MCYLCHTRMKDQCCYIQILPFSKFKTNLCISRKLSQTYTLCTAKMSVTFRAFSSQIIQLVEGKASAYVFASPGCKKWDTCATEAILHAVGGTMSISLCIISLCFSLIAFKPSSVQNSVKQGSLVVTQKES